MRAWRRETRSSAMATWLESERPSEHDPLISTRLPPASSNQAGQSLGPIVMQAVWRAPSSLKSQDWSRGDLVVQGVNSITFVAPNLAWGEARGASARAPGASPASGGVTDEQRSPRPNGAQPSGRRFFAAQAALLAPYRSTDGMWSAARAEAPRALPGP